MSGINIHLIDEGNITLASIGAAALKGKNILFKIHRSSST